MAFGAQVHKVPESWLNLERLRTAALALGTEGALHGPAALHHLEASWTRRMSSFPSDLQNPNWHLSQVPRWSLHAVKCEMC